MRHAPGAAVALLFCLIRPAASFAQEPNRIPPPGTHAIAIAMPGGGGGSFALRKILGSGANLGITVHFAGAWYWRDGDQSNHTYEIGLGPDVRLYRRERGPVVPFLQLGGDVIHRHHSGGESWTDLGASAAIGAEWLPLPSVSLSGSTGLRLGYRHADDGAFSQDGLTVSAFRSALLLNLYF